MTIVTPSVHAAVELAGDPNDARDPDRGDRPPGELSLIGDLAERTFAQLNCDVLFLGVGGIHAEKGLTEYNLDDTRVKRAAIQAASRKVALADESKLDRVCLATIASLSEIDVLITDAAPDHHRAGGGPRGRRRGRVRPSHGGAMSQRMQQLFGNRKPLIAMVHVPPLPGTPLYDAARRGAGLISTVQRDLELLLEAGFDGYMFCNEGDRPYELRAGPEAAAVMSRVVTECAPARASRSGSTSCGTRGARWRWQSRPAPASCARS